MNDLNQAKELLESNGYTCVLCKGKETYTSQLRGVKPLVAWYAFKTNLNGFSAADKVVGKATAFLYVLHGVCAVYAKVISQSALAVLQENGIAVEYGNLAEYIINRQGDGICPFEGAVMELSDPKEAYKTILLKMEEMHIDL